jgi:hypothetical protein
MKEIEDENRPLKKMYAEERLKAETVYRSCHLMSLAANPEVVVR